MLKTLPLDKGQIEVVDDRVAEILRTKSGPERLNMVWADWSFFQMRITAYLKSEHPDWTEEQIRKEIFRRVTYGDVKESNSLDV
jgi:hypothetical protein